MNITAPTKVEFIITDDNAFAVLAGFQRAARLAGWSNKQLNDLTEKCVTGNYSQLICTLASHCTKPRSRSNC